VSDRARRAARRRSLVVLAIFTMAMLIAFVAPRLGFGLICGTLILHLKPEAGSRPSRSFGRKSNRGQLHKSMTTSRIGCEQQMRRLPSAGLSSGSGP
jgi:hypothetical protein